MAELSESDRIYIGQLKLTMEYYQRIVYQINKVRSHFRDPEKTMVEKILGGRSAKEAKRELASGGQTQKELHFRG